MGHRITVDSSGVGVGNDCGIAIKDNDVGDALSVALSEDPASPIIWKLLVDVQTYEGRFRLGIITTTAPAGNANPPSRVVGFGQCPGAIAWYVLAIPSNSSQFPTFIGSTATLHLATSRQATAVPGVITNVVGPNL